MDLGQCEAVPGGMIQCPERAVDTFRARAASGQLRYFPLCPEHIQAWEDRAHAERSREAQQRALADYVRQWRDEHPMLVYSRGWQCPLCSFTVQTIGSDVEYESEDIRGHQGAHGDDWEAYVALAEPRAMETS